MACQTYSFLQAIQSGKIEVQQIGTTGRHGRLAK
jgi:hypothetical protein